MRKLLRLDVIVGAVISIIVGLLVSVPVVMLLYGSLRTAPPGAPGNFTFGNYLSLFSFPWFWQSLFQTLEIAGITIAVAITLGLPLAWLEAKTDLGIIRRLKLLLISTYFLSPLTVALAWGVVGSPRTGFLNTLLRGILGPQSPVINAYSIWGIGWVSGVFLSTYVYLFFSNALASTNPALEEAAKVCGASGRRTFYHISLPISRPALLSAVLLAFVISIESFGISIVLGLRDNIYPFVVRTYMVALFVIPANWPLATALSVVLLSMSSVAMYLYWRLVGQKPYSVITGKGFSSKRIRLGKWKYLALAFLGVYLLFVMVIPVATIVLSSISASVSQIGLWTLANYVFIFGYPLFGTALLNSLLISVVGPSISIVLGLFASFVVIRAKSGLGKIIDYLSNLMLGFPSMVIGVGMLWAFLDIPGGRFIVGTLGIMILAVIARFVSFSLRSISPGLILINRELEESARVCGSSWMTSVRRIVVPLIKQSISSAWILQFVIFFRELDVFIMLWTGATIPLSVLVYETYQNYDFSVVAAMTVIQTLIIFAFIAAYYRITGKGFAEVQETV